jgi:hypothetical protein
MTKHEDVLGRDEIRRQLRETTVAHTEAMPRWRDALQRTFDPSSKLSGDAKAQMLGLPDRRGFLKIGGATVALSVVAAACSSVPEEQIPVSGTTPPSLDDSGVFDPSEELDLTLLRTAQSIEVLAVETYQKVLETDLLSTPAVNDAARLFMDQHQEHAALLATTTEDLGGEAYNQANEYLFTTVVEPALIDATDEEMAVELALVLENTAAQTYVFAAEILSTPALRQAIMSIGGVEARHVSVLYGVQGQPQVPFAFMPRRARIPDKGFIEP